MTYAELLQMVQDMAEYNETTFVANLPRMVQVVEERIYRIANIPGIRAEVEGLLTAGSRDIDIPDGFVNANSLEVQVDDKWFFVTPKDYDFLTEAYPTDMEGVPTHYAQFDEAAIRLAPAPDNDYSYRLTYTSKPPSITTGAPSWILENAQEALLYGVMVEAYIFMKGEDDMMQLYDRRFREALGIAADVSNHRTRTDEWREAPPMRG